MRKTNGSEAYGQAVAERKDMLHLLEWLCCPFCGGRLNREKIDHADLPQGWGILSCYCGRYPMAAGIPVLKKDPALERVIALIENGHHQEALLTLIPIPDPVASSASPQVWFGSRLKRKLRRVFGLSEKTMDPALWLWRERIGSVLSDRSDQANFVIYWHFISRGRRIISIIITTGSGSHATWSPYLSSASSAVLTSPSWT